MIKKVLALMFVVLMGLQFSAFAAINVGQRTGTLKITMPDGTVLTVAPGDALPLIPDGATLEVIGGIAQISTTDGSIVQVVAGAQTVNVSAGSTLNVIFEPTGAALLGITEGSAQVVTTSGSLADLGAGDQIRVGAGVLSATGFDVIQGQVPLTLADGTMTTEAPGTVEGYTPPALPDANIVDTAVQSEERAADISPVGQ